MKLLNSSLSFFSKFKRNYIFSSYKTNLVFRRKAYALNTFSSFIFSPYRCFSVTSKKDSLSSNGGKLFQEIENEHAHQIMENLSFYGNSLIKYPSQNGICTYKVEGYSGHLNIVDKFVQVTLHNLSEGLSLEDKKFVDLVEKVCYIVPETSDENIKKILHYLCMWPAMSSTTTPNFKLLWNLLDQECVKRLQQWDELFNRKFSKMTQENNHLVFVYGTLKKGEPNHDLIEKRTEGIATFLGNAKTVKKWPLIIASRYNIPYLLYSEGRGMNVIGEIYEVDDIMLAKLDALECHPDYYTRLIEDVHTISEGEEKLLKLWIYFLKNFRPELLQLPCLSEYSSKGSHGFEYVSRYNRSGQNYYSDVMDV